MTEYDKELQSGTAEHEKAIKPLDERTHSSSEGRGAATGGDSADTRREEQDAEKADREIERRS